MATPHSLHHSLLRPSILHILRAAGFTSCRPSVLDTVTDLAARYLITLAESAAYHADLNEHDTEIDIQDVRMAMQDCGLFVAEKMMVDQDFEGEEDTRGVDQFVKWAIGKKNREIRRIAMENGDGTKEDYLTALKKKHSTTEDDARYDGTMLGKPAEPRSIKVEGGEISSLQEWVDKLRAVPSTTASTISSRRDSSALSTLGESPMSDIQFSDFGPGANETTPDCINLHMDSQLPISS